MQEEEHLDANFKILMARVKNYLKALAEPEITKTVGYSGDIKIVTQNIAPNYVLEDIDFQSKLLYLTNSY